ncbi:GDSL esterase/lipase, partial [Trifolium pratense]
FKLQHLQELDWAKVIWSLDIPPSKSLLVWRLMHNKMPTDDNIKIWSWFANCLNLVLHFTPVEDMWKLCDMNWSPQCKITITAALVNLINAIWDHIAALNYCFVEPLGETSSFQPMLCAAMRAIEVAYNMNSYNLWLESDSELVVHAFKNTNFMVAEGNQVADTLANHGCSLSSFTYWHQVPDVCDWLKLGATGSKDLIFSAGVWWSWRHRNLMCLNNET